MTSPSGSSKRALAFLVALAGAGGGFMACGNKNPAPYAIRPPDQDASGAAGSGITPITGIGGQVTATGKGGSGVPDAGPPSGTVSITIQSPMGGSLLSSGAAADVAAKITVMGGTDVIDPASVRASLAGMGIAGAVSAAPLVGPTGDNLYTGKLSVAGLPSGTYTLTITAQSSTGVAGTASEMVSLDAGPQITVISPLPGKHYKGSLIVEVIIDPGQFAPATNIACTIAGQAVTLQPTGAPNVFRAVVDLTMPIALMDDQLFEISAQDSSKVKATTDLKFVFNVDITGPTITNTTPAPGAIVGQVIKLSASIADPAGLDASSIQVLIGDKTNPQFRLPLAQDTMGAFSTLFDSRLLTSCKLAGGLCLVRPTVSFRAADALGNESTVAYEIALDNIPPIADLVPPPVRSFKIDNGAYRCSFPYSPTSRKAEAGDAPDDGCQVPQLFDLRARIEDDGNRAVDIKEVPVSGVDPNNTAAYILADTSQPLVVDNDGDGFCDVINPKLVPTTAPLTGPRQVLKVRLGPVTPAGQPDYRPDLSIPATYPCIPGDATDPPVEICRVENPLVAISYLDMQPAIWSIEPIAAAPSIYCFGSQFDTAANNVPESGNTDGTGGWRCLAIATADKNGNVSTSMPLRLWVKNDNGGSDAFCVAPPATAGPMPSCTGTYNKASDTVSATACKARTFAVGAGQQELCFENNCD